MSGFKYGALILPSREGLKATLALDDATELVPAKLGSVMDLAEAKHWGEWIGSIEWERLVGADALVISRIASETPEVMVTLPRSSGHLRSEGEWRPWNERSAGSSRQSTRPRWCGWSARAGGVSGRFRASST